MTTSGAAAGLISRLSLTGAGVAALSTGSEEGPTEVICS